VTQPAGCSVVGGGGTVTINHDGASYWMWGLSEGCTVSGVKIVGADFTLRFSIFSPASNVLIENCRVDFDSNGCLLYANYAGSIISSVNISKNIISNGALVSSLGVSYTVDPDERVFYKWKVLNNTITGTSSGNTEWLAAGAVSITSAIELRQHLQAEVSGNAIRIQGGSGRLNSFYVLSLVRCSEVSVYGNDILMRVVDVSDRLMSGVYSDNSNVINVQANIFRRTLGAQGPIYGAYLDTGNSYLNICNNTFRSLEAAVYAPWSLSGCSISDNACDNLYGGGVYLQLSGGNSENISMCRNTFRNCTYSAVPSGNFETTTYAMILVEVAYSTYVHSVQNLVVSGNIIQDVSSGKSMAGILLNLQALSTAAYFGSIIVSDNSIRGLSYTGSLGTAQQKGISVFAGVNNSVVNGQINNNQVRFVTQSTAVLANMALGIEFYGAVFGGISNNLVHIYQPSGEHTLATGIWVQRGEKLKISGNNIDCVATGIHCDGEGALISDNKIVATGTGIYVNDVSSYTTSVKGNDVRVNVQSDAGSVLDDSTSPYGAGGSYGFVNGGNTSRILLEGNSFYIKSFVISGGSGSATISAQSSAIRLVDVLEMDLIGNSLGMDVVAQIGAVSYLSACYIQLKASGVTRLNIKSCIISDAPVSGLMDTRSIAGGLNIQSSIGWNPLDCALTGFIEGNVFNTSQKLWVDTGTAYVKFNDEVFTPSDSAENYYPYCIHVSRLPSGFTTVKGHRSLLRFFNNMIHAPLPSSWDDGESSIDEIPVALVYLPTYGRVYDSPNLVGCCLYDTESDNTVTFNGKSGQLLGTPGSTSW
jgi:hypothetical protein